MLLWLLQQRNWKAASAWRCQVLSASGNSGASMITSRKIVASTSQLEAMPLQQNLPFARPRTNGFTNCLNHLPLEDESFEDREEVAKQVNAQ